MHNSFYTFNEDVMDVIFEVANKKIEAAGSELKIKLESKNNN